MALPVFDVAIVLGALVVLSVARLVLGLVTEARGRQRIRPLPRPIRREAEKRAEALLGEHLSEHDYRQLCLLGYLDVPSGLFPQRYYRIYRYPESVRIYEDGRCIGGLCAMSLEPLPSGDVVLLHKLMIEANEQEYLRVARRLQ